jgi:peptide deformylase
LKKSSIIENGIIPIRVFGDKILRQKTKPIKDIDDDLINFIANMYKTMEQAHGIGLAANQVGLDKSVFIVDISHVEGYEKFTPITFINPTIKSFSDEISSFNEGCLSLPNLRGEVNRPKAIEIVYYDINMKEQKIEADDLLARVIQHEYDHLQGILFTDRLDKNLKEKIKPELLKIKRGEVEIDYEIYRPRK